MAALLATQPLVFPSPMSPSRLSPVPSSPAPPTTTTFADPAPAPTGTSPASRLPVARPAPSARTFLLALVLLARCLVSFDLDKISRKLSFLERVWCIFTCTSNRMGEREVKSRCGRGALCFLCRYKTFISLYMRQKNLRSGCFVLL